MSVDTKGVVVTPCKDVFLVISLVERALNSYMRKKNGPWRLGGVGRASSRLVPDMGFVQVDFTDGDQKRTLHVFFTCDSDHENLAPHSLSLSLGAYGDSVAYMSEVLWLLSALGDAYIDENDADDIPLAPLSRPPVTYMDACLQEVLPPNKFSLAIWVATWTAGGFRGGATRESFEDVMGLSYDDALEILELGNDAATQRIKQAVIERMLTPEALPAAFCI